MIVKSSPLAAFVGAAAGAALLLVGASGCSKHTAASPPAEKAEASTYRAVAPVRKSLTVTIEQPGQIEAFEQTPVNAKIAGYVAEVCVDMDARVKKGDCLAKLWVPEMEDDLRQKQALVAQGQAELEQVKRTLQTVEASIKAAAAHVAESRSGLKRAQANQERYDSELKRIQALVKREVIDRQTLDEAENQSKATAASLEEAEAKIRSAEATLDEGKARREKVLSDIEVAKTRLRVAQSDEQRAKTMLEYAAIQAPFTGVVTRRAVHTGHLVKPGDGGREPLFVVVRTDPVRIFVNVPEAEAHLVRVGTPAQVRIQALRDQEIPAKVTRTSWALDPGNRTLRAEIELPNPDGALRPGMYAYAAIQVEHPPTWTVPAAVVHKSDDAPYCYLCEDGKAVRAALRTGTRAGDVMEVLKKRSRRDGTDGRWQDVTGDEKFIEGNISGLAEGRPVSIGAPKR